MHSIATAARGASKKSRFEHVHVHAGGQAVVGVVESPGGEDRPISEDQPHAKQIAHAPQPAVWSADKERQPLPVSGDAERMHGGMSPGAPKGNKNAFKHGHYTAEAIASRREIAKLLRDARALVKQVS
jgi:hypothetical protein